MTKNNRERYNDLANFLNLTAKSGHIDERLVILEMAKLLKIKGAVPKEK